MHPLMPFAVVTHAAAAFGDSILVTGGNDGSQFRAEVFSLGVLACLATVR